VLSRLHPKSDGEQIVDKHDLVSAYCIRDLNQDHGLSAHGPQSPKISSADHMLTRQVLSSTVTIRVGGGCAAPRRQIKLTLTAAFESPIPQSINEGGGDSGARWHL
jgi:hypothetical protein